MENHQLPPRATGFPLKRYSDVHNGREMVAEGLVKLLHKRYSDVHDANEM